MTYDSETTHTLEEVNFLVVEGDGILTAIKLNIPQYLKAEKGSK